MRNELLHQTTGCASLRCLHPNGFDSSGSLLKACINLPGSIFRGYGAVLKAQLKPLGTNSMS